MKTEYEEFLEATADLTCDRAHEFSNRAAARGAFARHDEALRNHDRACNLDPNNASFLLNPSALFL